MNTRPPSQPAASFADELRRAVTVADNWRTQAEHLHTALNGILGAAELAAAGRVPQASAVEQIRDIARDALTRRPR